MKKTIKTPLAAAMGTAFISAFSAQTVQAESNPFGMTELSEGYMQVAEAGSSNYSVKPWGKKSSQGSCGEGRCGSMMEDGKMKKGMESSCGAMMKGNEGACGMQKAKPAEKAAEGKCGEGQCGGMMNGGAMKKGMESSCGAMMKGKEGACGMGMGKMGGMKGEGMSCGAMMKGGEMSCGAMVDSDKAAGE